MRAKSKTPKRVCDASHRGAQGGGRARREGGKPYGPPLCRAAKCAAKAGPPPGSAWGLCKPWKGILPASRSGGAEYSVPCITCPAPVNEVLPVACCNLSGIEYHPASLEADSESLFTIHGTAEGHRFAKTNKTTGQGPGFCRGQGPFIAGRTAERPVMPKRFRCARKICRHSGEAP